MTQQDGIKLVDSHCHLHLSREQPEDDPSAAIAAAEAEGVEHFLNVAVNIESAPLLADIAARFPQVSVSVGVHPSAQTADPSVAELVRLAAPDTFVAIGETGLDYHYNEGDLEWQRDRFRRHVRAARELSKPLIIHTRNAAADTLRILREERADEVGGVIHCFTEDWDTASACMDLGFYISLSGIVTFRNADSLRDVAKRLPLERLLIETDAPYLAPVPHRGKPNQPAYVRYVAECIAEVRECELSTVARATYDNFFELFPLAKA